MLDFDILLIGAGPTALAALDGIGAAEGLGIVTGAVPVAVPAIKLHAKIRAVAIERRETPGVADPLSFGGPKTGTLFSTAAMGGLACYWGQQFVRQSAGDPWPRQIFADYDAYEVECAEIERLFVLSGGGGIDSALVKNTGFDAHVPRLLVGTPQQPHAGLSAMTLAFVRRAEETRAKLVNARAKTFAETPEGWRVELDDGQTLVARRILLATGAIGTAHLLMRSYRDLTKARFRDHTPWMSYMLGLRRLIATRPQNALGHFNIATLTREKENTCTVFASVYDMRRAEMNLLTASTIGRTFTFLKGWNGLPGTGLIQPMQVWTALTGTTIELDAQRGAAFAQNASACDPSADRDLAELTAALTVSGIRALKVSRTQPGFGFHYHALDLRPGEASYLPVETLLRQRTGGGVVCVDASILGQIGRRPHTLTAMAAARYLARHLVTAAD